MPSSGVPSSGRGDASPVAVWGVTDQRTFLREVADGAGVHSCPWGLQAEALELHPNHLNKQIPAKAQLLRKKKGAGFSRDSP